VIQVSDVGVVDSFWFSRGIVWVVGLFCFWALMTFVLGVGLVWEVYGRGLRGQVFLFYLNRTRKL